MRQASRMSLGTSNGSYDPSRAPRGRRRFPRRPAARHAPWRCPPCWVRRSRWWSWQAIRVGRSLAWAWRSLGDLGIVVAVDASVFQPDAAKRASWSVESVSSTGPSMEIVVVPDDDQLVELEMAGQRDGFLADAFHQAAVAGEHIGVVVDQPVAEFVSCSLRSAMAMPTALAMPWPSGPVVVSMPAAWPNSG
jgi:hypothetical protein